VRIQAPQHAGNGSLIDRAFRVHGIGGFALHCGQYFSEALQRAIQIRRGFGSRE